MKVKALGRTRAPTPRASAKKGGLLDSREARVGTLVRLLDGARRGARGRVGTIERTYGHPDYLAADVRFEDGGAELCWHHELAKADAAPFPPGAPDDGG